MKLEVRCGWPTHGLSASFGKAVHAGRLGRAIKGRGGGGGRGKKSPVLHRPPPPASLLTRSSSPCAVTPSGDSVGRLKLGLPLNCNSDQKVVGTRIW